MIFNGDIKKILFPDGTPSDRVVRGRWSGGGVYLDDVAAGAEPLECTPLAHVSPGEGQDVLVIVCRTGAAYAIGVVADAS